MEDKFPPRYLHESTADISLITPVSAGSSSSLPFGRQTAISGAPPGSDTSLESLGNQHAQGPPQRGPGNEFGYDANMNVAGPSTNIVYGGTHAMGAAGGLTQQGHWDPRMGSWTPGHTEDEDSPTGVKNPYEAGGIFPESIGQPLSSMQHDMEPGSSAMGSRDEAPDKNRKRPSEKAEEEIFENSESARQSSDRKRARRLEISLQVARNLNHPLPANRRNVAPVLGNSEEERDAPSEEYTDDTTRQTAPMVPSGPKAYVPGIPLHNAIYPGGSTTIGYSQVPRGQIVGGGLPIQVHPQMHPHTYQHVHSNLPPYTFGRLVANPQLVSVPQQYCTPNYVMNQPDMHTIRPNQMYSPPQYYPAPRQHPTTRHPNWGQGHFIREEDNRHTDIYIASVSTQVTTLNGPETMCSNCVVVGPKSKRIIPMLQHSDENLAFYQCIYDGITIADWRQRGFVNLTVIGENPMLFNFSNILQTFNESSVTKPQFALLEKIQKKVDELRNRKMVNVNFVCMDGNDTAAEGAKAGLIPVWVTKPPNTEVKAISDSEFQFKGIDGIIKRYEWQERKSGWVMTVQNGGPASNSRAPMVGTVSSGRAVIRPGAVEDTTPLGQAAAVTGGVNTNQSIGTTKQSEREADDEEENKASDGADATGASDFDFNLGGQMFGDNFDLGIHDQLWDPSLLEANTDFLFGNPDPSHDSAPTSVPEESTHEQLANLVRQLQEGDISAQEKEARQ